MHTTDVQCVTASAGVVLEVALRTAPLFFRGNGEWLVMSGRWRERSPGLMPVGRASHEHVLAFYEVNSSARPRMYPKSILHKGDAPLSTTVSTRPEPADEIHPVTVPYEWRNVDRPSHALSAQPQPLTTPRRKKKKTSRQLTPQKIGVAWEKVRRVVRDISRQPGRNCPICCLYGNPIEIQPSSEYHLIVLELQDGRIIARIAAKQWTIRIVRIKTGGSGYEFRKKIRSATFLLIELMSEARGAVGSPNR